MRFVVLIWIMTCRAGGQVAVDPAVDSSNFYGSDQGGDWARRKAIALKQRSESYSVDPNGYKKLYDYGAAAWFPEWHCDNEERVGKLGDGGKWVCELNKLQAKSSCLVYSFGCNNNFSFEQRLKEFAPLCEIFVFDHTMKTLNNDMPLVLFTPIGLAGKSNIDVAEVSKILPALTNRLRYGESSGDIKIPKLTTGDLGTRMNLGVASLPDVVTLLGHSSTEIDVLKIDVEQHEFELTDLFEDPEKFAQLPKIRQILIEVHSRTKRTDRLMRALVARGYVVFHRELNYIAPWCIEYGLVYLPGLITA